jgi:hypothetical protein
MSKKQPQRMTSHEAANLGRELELAKAATTLQSLNWKLLSLRAEAVALRAGAYEDETSIKSNCNGRIWVIDQVMRFLESQ